MTAMQILFLGLVFVLVAGTVYGVSVLVQPDAARRRLQQIATNHSELPEGPESNPLRAFVRWLAAKTRPLAQLSAPDEGFERSPVKLKLVHAGMRGSSTPAMFFGLKTALTLIFPMLGLVALTLTGGLAKANSLMLPLVLLAALGYYLPNIVLNRLVLTRQREIFESFPDALDLMTICVEAGLGTEAAMLRVAEDLQFRSPTLAEELKLVNLELRAGADRERALRNLAIRTGVDEVDSFVSMINQAERFGTSIGAALRVHSDMLRSRRRQRAEEAAAKIALKLLFPLIVCIFPAILVVVAGPSIIQISKIQIVPNR